LVTQRSTRNKELIVKDCHVAYLKKIINCMLLAMTTNGVYSEASVPSLEVSVVPSTGAPSVPSATGVSTTSS
jgi:hypothetical protein